MSNSIFYNAHHSPIGAFASFTLGYKGKSGGLGLELAGPAEENVYVGIEEADRTGYFQTLPFYEQPQDASQDYDVEGHSDLRQANTLNVFEDDQITRMFGAGVDEWTAGDLKFRIVSPVGAVPDPERFDAKDAVTPAVLVELTVDNRSSTSPRRAFFGYGGSDRAAGMRILDEPGLVGVGQGTTTAIATLDVDLYTGLAWQPEAIFSAKHESNRAFMLGSLGLIVGTVAPGEVRTFQFAVGFFREGTATTGIRTKYLYRRYFNKVEEVLAHALTLADQTIKEAERFDKLLVDRLSKDRAFMLAHAVKSYFGSTQLLEREDGRPLWVVNEGEYRMMNTFDLTVDQTFLELVLNPWTVRNVLDLFVERYSYPDGARVPGSSEVHNAGISFTHDMGVANIFSRPGYSGYEQAGLTGCFSYMSAEELMNWVLTAGLYLAHTNDDRWSVANKSVFLDCLSSLQNRDNPIESERNGVVGSDGDRCEGGAEITTYDSLDTSLGQARNSLYLAVKAWACYLVLEEVLQGLGEETASIDSQAQGKRAAATILLARDENGLFPAVIGEGVDARIIPAIEALVYPHVIGIIAEESSALKQALLSHFNSVMKPGVCKFDDGGWKLSSTSRNSWLSKIYLCQYVAEAILHKEPDARADAAHVTWLLDPENSFYAWSDQMLAGKAVGSRYYPRGVTGILWLAKGESPLSEIQDILAVAK